MGQRPSSPGWEAAVFDFLNSWQCRITRDAKTRARIVDTVNAVWEILSPEEYDSNLLRFRRMPRDAFEALAGVEWRNAGGYRRKLGPTATGKILHLLRPDVFVMWDAAIRNHYDADGDSAGYEGFMRIMALGASRLVREFRALCTDRTQSLQMIMCRAVGCDHPQPISLSKLMDEYNWITITSQARLPHAQRSGRT